MWKKTLLAAAVGSFVLSARAQDAQPPAAPATTPKDDETTRLPTVTVAGEREEEGFKAEEQLSGKLPLTVRETPQSITVLTRESLDDRQVFNLQQALELSAGATQYSGNGPFAGQPSFGFNQTTIRGIAIDDLYDFRDDGFVSGSYFALPDLAIYERIEVVKGPNSVLYGRGSVGGLINRVRKKPQSQFATSLELSGGSYDTWRADLDVTGALLDSRAARGRLVAAYEDSGSFVRGAQTQRTVLAPSVELDLAPGTRLLLQALDQREDIVPNTGIPLQGTAFDDEGAPTAFDAPARLSRRQLNGIASPGYEWKIQSVQAQLEQELGDRWLATLRLSSHNIDTPIRVDSYIYGFRNEDDDPDTAEVERRGDTNVVGSRHFIDRDVWSGEIQFSGSFELAGRTVKASFGADHNQNQYSRRGIYSNVEGFYGTSPAFNLYDGNFVPPPLSFDDEGADFGGDPRSTGYYAQAQIHATERLKVLLGARYDDVKLRAVDHGVTDKASVNDLTGRLGLTYEVNTQVSVYGVYAQSFSPVLFDFDQNGQLLDPETGEIHEAGLKTEWFERRLGVNAAVYRVDREKVPVSVGTPPDTYSVSSGLQRSEGYEIEINGRPLPGWDLSLAYNRVDSQFEDADVAEFDGMRPGATPDWQLGLYSAYELQGGPLKGLGFGATYFSIDERGVSAANPAPIPGYERVDLHAFYKGIRNVEINLLVRNVSDNRYVEGADRPGAYAQFGSPTAAMLSVKYSIGGS